MTMNRAKFRKASIDHGEDVVLGHDEILLAVEAHLVAGVGGEEHAVADLHLERGPLAIVERLAFADREHLALLGLLLGRVREDDAPGCLLVGLQTLHEDLLVQRDDLHRSVSWSGVDWTAGPLSRAGAGCCCPLSPGGPY